MAKSKNGADYCCLCNGLEDQIGPLVGREGSAKICFKCANEASTAFKQAPDLMKKHYENWNKHVQDLYKQLIQIPLPTEIYNQLSERVIGQDRAKRVISIACCKHFKRIQAQELDMPIKMDKQNILLIGPTGVGKTEIARAMADSLGVPFAIGDATTLTEAGYVGEDVENLLLKLLHAADWDTTAAEQGVIYIDEIDKIGKKSQNVSITRDVSGEGVQQCLLKMIEGTTANVPPQGGRKHPEQQYVRIDTSNILFICGGAFVGIEDIVAQRLRRKKIGFDQSPGTSSENQSDKDTLREQVTPDDLIKFGMIPEFVGRLPVQVSLKSLTVEDLEKILVEPNNSRISQIQQSFEMNDVKLVIEKPALRAIAKKAHDLETGARGIDAVVSKVFEDYEFNIGDYANQTITITDDMVNNGVIQTPKKEAA